MEEMRTIRRIRKHIKIATIYASKGNVMTYVQVTKKHDRRQQISNTSG